jgi:flagellar biosynthesis component FlhA
MATTINEPKEITLPDGTVIAVRPLKISLLRDFMKTFTSIEDVAEDNDKSMDLLIECVRIAMRQYKPELAEDAAKLEDVLDLPTVYRIIEEASGVAMGNQFIGGKN